MSDGLRVVVADDHVPTRVGIRAALEADGCDVVADVCDAADAVAAVEEHRPDVCLLDINMPGSGIWAAGEISKGSSGTPIVMLTASRDDSDLFDALRTGAVGYLLKDIDPDRLGAALRGVLAGEAALPRSLVLRLMEEFRGRPRRGLLPGGRPAAARLTERESEVLALMTEGLATHEIAARLYVGQVTVRTHIANILKKLRVPDRESAIRLAQGVPD